MNIKIDEKVKQHLKNKGINVLTVELETSDSCCIPTSLPHVKLETPQATEKYDLFESEGITVYVYKGAVVKNALKLTLHNYLLFKEIEVSGIQIL